MIACAFIFGVAFGSQAKTTTSYALSSGTRLAAGATNGDGATNGTAFGAPAGNGLGSATGHRATDPFVPQLAPALLYFSARPSTSSDTESRNVSTPFAFAATKPDLPLLRTTTGGTSRARRANDTPSPSSAPQSSSAPAPPPVPVQNSTPITISDVHTVALTPFSATIEWKTSEEVSSQVAYGLDTPTVWTPADAATTSHVATVGGLVDGTTYHLRVDAKASDGRTASSPLVVTTPSLPAHHPNPALTVHNDGFQLDGRATIPTIVWAACADQIPSLLAVGIDTFLGKNCGDGSREVAALGARGQYIGDAFQPATPGAAGSFLPDEWDTHLPNDLTSADVQRQLPDNAGGSPRFLTLTNHFFSGAAPLPQGRGMYPALVANADVIGFDLYPLENWCRYDDFAKVFDSQRELTQLAAGKPTYQWIETAHMDCADPSLDPTPQTVHAETWLAAAGGAHAIGYFPKDFSPSIGEQIARDKRELEALAPALVEPPVDATGSGKVRVGAREHNGAIYVIAVNASREPSTSAISVPALGNRSLAALDGSHPVTAANGTFTDSFEPLEVRIYVAAP